MVKLVKSIRLATVYLDGDRSLYISKWDVWSTLFIVETFRGHSCLLHTLDELDECPAAYLLGVARSQWPFVGVIHRECHQLCTCRRDGA
jgi:hypothetical protein